MTATIAAAAWTAAECRPSADAAPSRDAAAPIADRRASRAA
ncbi:hypothetical protein ACLQ24_24550 [Micromonospora sp. DT4]